jgi:ADP-heptose:LPS heptosyltransferase
VLRINHSLEPEFKTIVISKYAGLGSIIQATPLIQTLRKKYPRSKLIFVTTRANAALFNHIPEIDEIVLVFDKNLWDIIATSLQLLIRMWRIKPELYIDLEFYSNYSGIITTLCKGKNRLGFYNQDRQYRQGIYNYLVPFRLDMPISESYLQFANLLNCGDKVEELKLKIGSDLNAHNVLSKLGLQESDKYLIVNPNASDLRIERRWSKDSYIDTINYLQRDFPSHKIILIGNKAEAAYVTEIESGIVPVKNPILINSAGRLTLSELIVLIAGAGLMLTNDTGPMHIAYAFNVKTIALFGPCSPLQYAKTENSITFYKKVECSPCVHTFLTPPCKGNNICMKLIQTNEVKLALAQSLQP